MADFQALLVLAALCTAATAQYERHYAVLYDQQIRSACYDADGRAQRCIPEFVNAAFNVKVEATNTCGLNRSEPTRFCPQTDVPGTTKTCEECSAYIRGREHPPEYLTDLHNNENVTWWQSETMLDGVQYPNQVNLTLNLGRAFDITYIRLKFHSMRPESFAIYKRTTEDGPWVPYHYYSSTCLQTYGIKSGGHINRDDETRALCTAEYTALVPLTGGNVAFSTLEGRPSAFHFETSSVLQEWVTATSIRIVLTRLNTFGDEIFGDKQVLRSYYYAISDFAVGGRCKCNGHAMACDPSSGDGRQQVCRCEHFTDGPNCERCLSSYNDQPWGSATNIDAHECKPCNCNGRSNKCYFDQDLYDRTGHGGHCTDCADNTDGPNCERCKLNYYQRFDGRCVACGCNELGSRSLQCNSKGQCPCKSGVEGQRCDRCAPNHYDFSEQGCRPCGCSAAGSTESPPSCDPETGECRCKANVEGRQCDRCKPGYFDVQHDNEFGCTPCFCFGHSSVCQSARGYSKYSISSTFSRDRERWRALDFHGRDVATRHEYSAHHLAVAAPGNEPVYFVAPDRYLGDQRSSYHQNLTFTLRIGEDGPRSSVEDIVLEGAHMTVSQPIFGQGNHLPSIRNQEYRFTLHEDPRYGWTPRLSAQDFISVLANLTSIKIKATYVPRGTGFIDNIHLQSAQRTAYGVEASWIEMCTCPEGYVGQFCESCAPGYRHDPPGGGRFSRCVPCNCNKHALICEPDTGRRCDLCFDGHYGDPLGISGPSRPCKKCDCNGNVDPNAVANCNTTTGECLKCIYNTAGYNCERCLPGHYGDALAQTKGDCKACGCNSLGTVADAQRSTPECDPLNGQCRCKANVIGRQCDQCRDGTWNLVSNEGCESCDCSVIGSLNHTCDARTGQCYCRPGVTGKHCDQCLPYHYGFSADGCSQCDCDSVGSLSHQCAPDGQCDCRPNVEGRRCERCKENKYDKEAGCIDCPTCYNLVQDAVNEHREKLAELSNLLDKVRNNPDIQMSDDFMKKLEEVMVIVDTLWRDAKQASVTDDSLVEKLDDLVRRIKKVQETAQKIAVEITVADNAVARGDRNLTEAEDVIERIRGILSQARRFLEDEGRDALRNAMERSDRYGQQSEMMSQIAREARRLSDDHEKDAKEIQSLAQDARNTSSEAQRIAAAAQDMQDQTEDEIKLLRRRMNQVKDLMERTKEMANEAKAEAFKAHDDAIQVLTDTNSIQLPDIDHEDLKNQAQDIIDDARRIQKEADDLMERHRDIVESIEPQREDAEGLLAEAEHQQQITDGLLAATDAALQKSKEAVESGERILKEAQNTLQTLKAFDENVKKSKEKAMEALDRIPEITDFIEDAENRTGEAREALEDAEDDAHSARDIAQEAERIAEQASRDANHVKNEADRSKDTASALREDADHVAAQVDDTDKRMKEYENQAKDDEALAKAASEKANEARTGATEAYDKARAALDTVNGIIAALENVDDVDTGDLNRLEERLRQAERDMAQARLDDRVAELQNAREMQLGWMRDYEDEINKLKKDVANVKDISESLPEGCFRRIRLEP
ncbi:laminin subunit gamma-1-like isoform X3 [Ornithodoros turicata]|uniref:laminin subunit gamma-1-like isoform X3 n=1 Tax=Ornithodoros turicata TaxID=34597 RepID=UPI00313A1454